jgi:hypothetical protein
MSHVILGFLMLISAVSAILVLFIMVFSGALLIFSRAGQEEKAVSRTVPLQDLVRQEIQRTGLFEKN